LTRSGGTAARTRGLASFDRYTLGFERVGKVKGYAWRIVQ